jgi:hypothetical protein
MGTDEATWNIYRERKVTQEPWKSSMFKGIFREQGQMEKGMLKC